jgi:hypothetical protein
MHLHHQGSVIGSPLDASTLEGIVKSMLTLQSGTPGGHAAL